MLITAGVLGAGNSLGHVQKLVQVDTAVGELLEGTLLLQIFIDLLHRTKKNTDIRFTFSR